MSHAQHDTDGMHEKLTEIFRNSFDRPTLEIKDNFGAKDIPGWDSLMQVNLIVSVEEEFDVRFTSKEIVSFECIGDMKRTIVSKKKAA
ncbi:MAG: acyl carrier protein [Planctomycetes bacterium]|nr:acyl carrier protein [Planctomycetota bacterium]